MNVHILSPSWKSVEVRRVELGDMEVMVDLMGSYFRIYRMNPPPQDRIEDLMRKMIEDTDKGIQFIALTSGGSPVGFATIYHIMSTLSQSEVALLNDLFVEKKYRGRGYGKLLFDKCIEYSKAQGFPKMEWMTEPDNHHARKFYTKQGAKWSEWIFFTMDISG